MVSTVDVTKVEIVNRTDLRLTFDDGVTRVVDVRPLMRGAVFSEIFKRDLFKQVAVVDGELVWPNGAKLDAAVLRFRSGGYATRAR